MRIAQSFKLWDYLWFKLTLVSFGVVLGMYFAPFFWELRALLWVVFGLSFLILITRMLRSYLKQ